MATRADANDIDVEDSCNNSSRISTVKSTAFLLAVGTVSVIGGVALTVGKHRKAGSGSKSQSAADQADGAKLAAKALGYGTAISVSGFALMIVAVKMIFNIQNMEDFDQKMKGVVPQKKDGALDGISYLKIERKQDTNQEEDNFLSD